MNDPRARRPVRTEKKVAIFASIKILEPDGKRFQQKTDLSLTGYLFSAETFYSLKKAHDVALPHKRFNEEKNDEKREEIQKRCNRLS